jgi:hypothetical protein
MPMLRIGSGFNRSSVLRIRIQDGPKTMEEILIVQERVVPFEAGCSSRMKVLYDGLLNFLIIQISVPDMRHFGTDPDPRIRTSD